MTKRNSKASATVRMREMAQRILAVADYTDDDDINQEIADKLVTAIGGDYEAWKLMDESDGLHYYLPEQFKNKFWMVRRLRNSVKYGGKLFESFKKS